ncbi:unnamed protein product [Amoebophrya sp. A25]|nr:unnamed protein product [Amoebophrya sp. A25]|eukprot:GSA25T00021034001.1
MLYYSPELDQRMAWADHRSPDLFADHMLTQLAEAAMANNKDLVPLEALYESPDHRKPKKGASHAGHRRGFPGKGSADGISKGGRHNRAGHVRGNRNHVDLGEHQKEGAQEVKVTTTVIHHHPPKETMNDVGTPPPNGGQTLLIAYFPWEATEDDVAREFGRFCQVRRVHLVLDKNNTRPRCFGFVKFASPEDAILALDATRDGRVTLNDSRNHVWHLKAEWAKTGDMVDDENKAGKSPVRKGKAGYKGAGGKGNSYMLNGSTTASSSSGSGNYYHHQHGYLQQQGKGMQQKGKSKGGKGGHQGTPTRKLVDDYAPPPVPGLLAEAALNADGAAASRYGTTYGGVDLPYGTTAAGSGAAGGNLVTIDQLQNSRVAAAQQVLMLEQIRQLSQNPLLPTSISALLQQQATMSAPLPLYSAGGDAGRAGMPLYATSSGVPAYYTGGAEGLLDAASWAASTMPQVALLPQWEHDALHL